MRVEADLMEEQFKAMYPDCKIGFVVKIEDYVYDDKKIVQFIYPGKEEGVLRETVFTLSDLDLLEDEKLRELYFKEVFIAMTKKNI